jgi:hypothetical protein
MIKSEEANEYVATLNYHLRNNDIESVENYLLAIGLDRALSYEVIDAARCINYPELVILLTTLAISNDHHVNQNRLILTSYQSIIEKKLKPELQALGMRNIITQTVNNIIKGSSNKVSFNKQVSFLEWAEGITLAADHYKFDLCFEYVTKMISSELPLHEIKFILQILTSRHANINAEIDWKNYARCIMALTRVTHSSNENNQNNALNIIICEALLYGNMFDKIDQYANDLTESAHDQFLLIKSKKALKEQNYDEAFKRLDAYCHYILHNNPNKGNINKKEQKDEFNLNDAQKALLELNEVLIQIQQTPFLVSGTLLGYAREKDFLSHDKDIDIGIIGWENQFNIIQALIGSGKFSIPVSLINGNKTYIIPAQHLDTGITIDIFYYHFENNLLVTGLNSEWHYIQRFGFTPFSLSPCKFIGIDFHVPSDVDLNLTENYGNWRIPDPDYITHLESPSMLDKGGLIHFLTSRLILVKALNDKKHHKINRIIDVMKKYSHSPYSMDPILEKQMMDWYECQPHKAKTIHDLIEA